VLVVEEKEEDDESLKGEMKGICNVLLHTVLPSFGWKGLEVADACVCV
jgi:hypothetical protein